MPSGARLERARKLGLCLECARNVPEEGFAKCKRCRHTKKLHWRRTRNAYNLVRRRRDAHRRALRAWIATGDLTAPPPEPPEWVPPRYWYLNRLQKWHRKPGKRKKRYKYTPRPLPKSPENVLICVETAKEGG